MAVQAWLVANLEENSWKGAALNKFLVELFNQLDSFKVIISGASNQACYFYLKNSAHALTIR